MPISLLVAQPCNCNVQQVKNNTVAPCNTVVGTIVNVSTAAQFKQAISQANNNGGNVTILLADGVYQVADPSSYPYITASNIVIRSASGNRDAVILEGNGMSQQPSTVNGLFFTGDNATVADLTIRNVGNHGIQAIGDFLYVHNIRFVDIFEQMFKGPSSGDGADNGRIQCSLFEYTAGIGPQWYIGGIDIHKGDNWVVNDNVFRDIASPSFSIAEHAIHFRNYGSNNTIERNEIVNCDRGIGFGLGADPAGVIGGIIRNNTIFNEGIDPYNDVGIILEQSPDTKIYNNTVHVQYQNAIEYRFIETTNAIIANNLTNKPITSRNGGTATVYSNYTQAQANWYVDAANGDLRLSGSPAAAVDQGVTLTEVTDDLDQTARPQGAGYDLGAYEKGSQPPPPPPVGTCDCTVQQVKNNTVSPCTDTMGTVVNVSTAAQFRQAINQANSSGGNLTILLADGVYQVANSSSYPYITADSIVIRSASGNRNAVILEGDGMVSQASTVNGLFFTGNHSVVADLTIRNVGNHGIQVIGDYLFVHNVRFLDIYEQMIKGASSGDGADNGRIQCSIFEYSAGIGPNWYIGGIDVHEGDNWIVRDNVFKDIASPFIATAEHAVHFWRTGSNITVERNEIINCDRGVGFGLGDNPANGITGGIIRNNTIYNEGVDPYHDVGIGLEYSPDTKVYNNTIHIQYQNAIEYRWTGTTNVDIANNLTNKQIRSRNGGTGNIYSNYTQAQANWYVNAANGDLRLSGSPTAAVDQGVALADVVVDLDQTARPQGAGYDLGAYEIPGAVPDSITADFCLWLEGAYDVNTNNLRTALLQRDLLPSIHPYNTPPWNHSGTEGQGWTTADYPANAVDWVKISFRTNTTTASTVATAAAVVLSDGCLFFPNPNVLTTTDGTAFYIVIEHRNHMAIMTPVPVAVTNLKLTYNFQTANSFAGSGFGQKELTPGVWAMYAGDGEQLLDLNGYDINGLDQSSWLPQNGLFNVYQLGDYNLDGEVTGSDNIFWFGNNGIFSGVER